MKTIHEENYVDEAERVMRALQTKDRRGGGFGFTTTQIRKLLSISADVYDGAKNEQGESVSQKLKEKLDYLRIQMIYQAGRNKDVKTFVEAAGLLDVLKETGSERKKVLLFCRYMEALVAYHRYLGGND